METVIRDDFDLYKIVNSGQCFRACCVKDDVYRFIYKEKLLYISRISKSDRYEVSCSEKEWEEIWQHYFDFETSYSGIRKRISPADEYIYEAQKAGAGIRILRQDLFEMLISFIISQRKSIPAIRSSIEKMCLFFGKNLGKDKYSGEDIYSFPTAEALAKADEEKLGRCGLGYRLPYICEASKKVASGEFDLQGLTDLTDREVFETLKSLKGVGDKVANCVLLFGYHRLDSAPIDTWIAKVINEEYDGENPFPQYEPYAGVVQQFVFYRKQHLKE